MSGSLEKKLERYTIRYPQEVLLVTAEIAGELDKILIFRGFSSSLMRSTAADPDVAVLPDDAVITSIDRLASPYQPDSPDYIEQQISWPDFSRRLASLND